MTIRKTIILLTAFLFAATIVAQQIPEKPTPARLVNDLAGVFSPEQANQLEQKLVQFNNETSNQIAVVTVNSFDGYDKTSFAQEIGEKWGIGQKGKNNGIVVLFKPKSKSEKGEVVIHVGYGLEGAVPDAIAKRIIEREMIPRFKTGNVYEGIDQACNTLIGLTKGEFTAEQYEKEQSGGAGAFVIIIIMVIGFIILSSIGRKGRQNHSAIGQNLPLWMIMGMMGSGRSSGKWGDFSSGGGSFGGGGGGFGGFGGGSFGGGGASGSW